MDYWSEGRSLFEVDREGESMAVSSLWTRCWRLWDLSDETEPEAEDHEKYRNTPQAAGDYTVKTERAAGGYRQADPNPGNGDCTDQHEAVEDCSQLPQERAGRNSLCLDEISIGI